MNYGSQRLFLPSNTYDKSHGANSTAFYLGKDLYAKTQMETLQIQQKILKKVNRTTFQQKYNQKNSTKANLLLQAQLKERIQRSQFTNVVNVLM